MKTLKKILKIVIFIVVILLIVFGVSYCVMPLVNANYDATATDLLNKSFLATDSSEMLTFISLSQVEKVYLTATNITTLEYTISAPVLYLSDDTTYIINKTNLYSISNNVYLEEVIETSASV